MDSTILSKHFVNSSHKKNTEDLVNFIKNEDIHRDQIVGISMNEVELEESDNIATLVYRQQSEYDYSDLANTLDFIQVDNSYAWEKHSEILDCEAANHDILAAAHSARNVGALNNSVIFLS